MWTHQYDQQVNQIACTVFEKPIFRTNNGEANLFGLEPNFGCCTANFGQGWPKFALSAYFKEDDALVISSPLPMSVNFDGNLVQINSEYPFRKGYTLTAEKDVTVKIRIPSWTEVSASVPFTMEHGFMRIKVRGGESVGVTFDMRPVLMDRVGGRKCLKYGALLFALPIESEKKMREYEKNGVERKFPYCDYSFTPKSAWNYAFKSENFVVEELPFDNAFSRENPPLKIKGEFYPVKWNFEKGYDLVVSTDAGKKVVGTAEELSMQPYGTTYLRITEMRKIDNEK
jgi:hypothetical protein